MKRFLCGATLLWLASVPACTTPPEEGTPPIESPDGPDAGAEVTECHGDPCGTPSAPDCCETSVCVDFGEWGDVHCANDMSVAGLECETGCVLELEDGTPVCSPAEYCGEGGIWPEVMCDRADSCDTWWEDEDACVDYVESCLASRSNSDELAWMNAVYTCTSYEYCGDFTDCMYNLGFCW